MNKTFNFFEFDSVLIQIFNISADKNIHNNNNICRLFIIL